MTDRSICLAFSGIPLTLEATSQTTFSFPVLSAYRSTLHLLSTELENYSPDRPQSQILRDIAIVSEAGMAEPALNYRCY